MQNHPKVVVVMATYRRVSELLRCLESIRQQTTPIHGLVLADNANDPLILDLLRKFEKESTEPNLSYLGLKENHGCGAGLKAAEEEALQIYPNLTHFWILDDDVVLYPTALEKLLSHMHHAEADLMAPILTDGQGNLWGFPEPRDAELRKNIRLCVTPQDGITKLGLGPFPLWWCTGACVLVSRRAVEQVGVHREDYWMLGEDHEFSMRVGNKFKTMFCCDVLVPHLPPAATDVAQAEQGHYLKFLSLLQNLCYNGFHLNYSGPMKKYVLGNYRRFFRTFNYSFRTMSHATLTVWYGLICGQPAGGKGGEKLRKRIYLEH